MVILFQLGDCVFLYLFVKQLIWLEGSQQTILFPVHHCVVFIDRKVKSGYQLPVLPGLVYVKLIVEFSVTWQEIDNQCHCRYKQQ